MGLMATVMSLLVFVVSANAACNPIPTVTEVPGSDRITLRQRYDVEFSSVSGGIHTCAPVFKCDNSSSLVLKSLTIKTKKMITFERFIVVDRSNQGMRAISFGGWNIPRSHDSTDYDYTYSPDIAIVAKGSLGVEATVIISSLTPIPPKETTVEILFQCRKIDPLAIPAPVPHEETYATLTSRFQVYVIPVVIFFFLFMLAIIRRCSPYATAKLKSLGDFTAKDEEEIKNHAGGGTWHDHVDDIVTDFKSRGVCEKRADEEEEEEMKDDSDDDSMSNSGTGSGSDPISATEDSVNTSNSGSSHSMESEESGDENTESDALDDEGSSDVNSDEDS